MSSLQENSVFTERELAILKDADENGAKPISPTLSSQMYALFCEGYDCAQIAKQNSGLSEKDVLYARRKYNWDADRDQYAKALQQQVNEKLIKSKFESVEFLTNILAVTHKSYKEQALKYIQTGKEEDKPKDWEIKSVSAYKSILEAIDKATGADKKTESKITGAITVKNENPGLTLTPELQSKLLKKLTDVD
jgi:hypothetical protein